MYECDNSSLISSNQYFVKCIIFLFYKSCPKLYSAWAGKFRPCEWTDNMMIYLLGGETEQHPELRQCLIIGQHTILVCVQKPS